MSLRLAPSAAAGLRAALLLRVMHIIDHQVRPVFKGVFYQATMRMLDLDGGTPQYSGNASANWYPSVGTPSGEYNPNLMPDVPRGEEPYSLRGNPNWAALEMSQARVMGFLASLPRTANKLILTNNTPYLRQYEPFGGDRLFRAQNLWPVTPDRVVEQTRLQFRMTKRSNVWRFA